MMHSLSPSPDVLVAHLDGEAVLLDLTTKRYFRLNATGATIWQELEAGHSPDVIVATLVERFEVEHDVATKAVADLIGELTERGLLMTGSETEHG